MNINSNQLSKRLYALQVNSLQIHLCPIHMLNEMFRFCRLIVGYIASFTLLNNQIAQLDCLLSFAIAAESAPRPYVRPQMFAEGFGTLELRELRHPCLELQEDVIYVANDAVFKKGVCNFQITSNY